MQSLGYTTIKYGVSNSFEDLNKVKGSLNPIIIWILIINNNDEQDISCNVEGGSYDKSINCR